VILAVAVNTKVLWYLTRGLGVCALLLLTLSIVLGVTAARGWRSARWPRFATASLHRNLTLLAICVVVLHVVTTVLDGYTSIKLQDAVVPFLSPYRPIWLGLGAVAFDLLIALVVTSLLRARIGYRAWRYVHWLAYLAWPVALVHALGTGSDARLEWLRVVGLASVAAVIVAVVVRFLGDATLPNVVRLPAVGGALIGTVVLFGWYQSGPAQLGWAKRAGTPVSLLASRRVRAPARPRPVAVSLPSAPFSSSLSGTVEESSRGGGEVAVVMHLRLNGAPGGSLRVDLRGEPTQGGVSMNASGVSFVPAGTRVAYLGSVTSLAGQDVVATVSTHAGARLALSFVLNIDTSSRVVTGTLDGTPL
jgi:DMSO/TMAO reductase YedYZ heme-binding membrane subunit